MPSSTSSSAKAPGRVVLLRVAIDTGSGGISGPLFADGRFEYIPVYAKEDRRKRTYGNTDGRCGHKLIDYFPPKRQAVMRDKFIHLDPEFETFTYGDPTRPKQSLGKLRNGDLLVFYAGLKGWGDCKTPPGLYIIGFFEVEIGGFYPDLKEQRCLSRFKKNWHVMHDDTGGASYPKGRPAKLVLVKGGRGSRLLKKARLISGSTKGKDRKGQPVFVLDPKLTRVFGTLSELNAIQRSPPRWVKPEFNEKAATFVRALK